MSETRQRGPVTEVVDRQYSEPIPDEFLPLLEAAGVTVDDEDDKLAIRTPSGIVAAVWGPAIQGHWFARKAGDEGVRVATRDDGIRYVLDLPHEEAP